MDCTTSELLAAIAGGVLIALSCAACALFWLVIGGL